MALQDTLHHNTGYSEQNQFLTNFIKTKFQPGFKPKFKLEFKPKFKPETRARASHDEPARSSFDSEPKASAWLRARSASHASRRRAFCCERSVPSTTITAAPPLICLSVVCLSVCLSVCCLSVCLMLSHPYLRYNMQGIHFVYPKFWYKSGFTEQNQFLTNFVFYCQRVPAYVW